VASSIDRVKQQIRERLDELDTEREQLLKALEALSGAPASSVGGRRGRPAASGARGGRSAGRADRRAAGRRAPRGQRRQQVVDALQGRELGPSAIAREIGDVNPTQVSGLLRQLASEGVVARTADGKWRLTAATEHAEHAQPGGPASNGGGPEGPSQEDSSAGF
jgi:hypothetical protein